MWRRFSFWERHALEAPRDVVKHTWPCAVAGEAGPSGVGVLFLGGDDGVVAVVDALRLRPCAGWKAHDTRVVHLVHCNKARRVEGVGVGKHTERLTSLSPLLLLTTTNSCATSWSPAARTTPPPRWPPQL
jgi:hypothetical protein